MKKKDKIIITFAKDKESIKVDVEERRTLKKMIAKLVIEFYPGAVVYHHGTAVRFRL